MKTLLCLFGYHRWLYVAARLIQNTSSFGATSCMRLECSRCKRSRFIETKGDWSKSGMDELERIYRL